MAPPSKYQPDLPPVPPRMQLLPTERGYPVPWFVAQVDGHYDFRVLADGVRVRAVRERRCWLCGQPLGRTLVFTLGPMCAINRTTAEPPSHRDCAAFAVQACPFLTLREPARRTIGLPDHEPMPGLGLERNPGVALSWMS